MADLVEWSYHHSESQGEALESQVSDALLNVHEMRLDLPLPHRVWRPHALVRPGRQADDHFGQAEAGPSLRPSLQDSAGGPQLWQVWQVLSAQPSHEPGLSGWPLNRTYLPVVIN